MLKIKNDKVVKERNIEETEIGIKLNRLAREQFKQKMLTDILVDLQVCELESIDKMEYITELKQEIDIIYNLCRRKI